MGIPVITLVIRRLKTSRIASQLVFATTQLAEDDELASVAEKEGVDVFRGAVDDVLSRYVEAASKYDFDYVVRVTGDCPFVDGPTLDQVLKQCITLSAFDLVTTKPAYPHGIDYEIYPKSFLESINKLPLTRKEREHHLNYIYKNEQKFKIKRLAPPVELKMRDTIFLLDTPSDYVNIKALLKDVDDIFVSPAELIKKHLYAN